jgi:Spy/CpxP family protein refolding chaperone
MRRRLLITFPGIAALVAGRAFSQTQAATTTSSNAAPHLSRKAVAKYSSGAKGAYKIPKNANKQTKYLNTLTAFLALTPGQQQQAAAIFSNAASARASLNTNLKSARRALISAVRNNDTGGIAQISATLGTLTAQHVSNGATANAAFFQLLTGDQQAKMAQFLG